MFYVPFYFPALCVAVNHFSTLESVQFGWILCSSIAFFLRCVFIAVAMYFQEYVAGVVAGLPVNHFPATEAVQLG